MLTVLLWFPYFPGVTNTKIDFSPLMSSDFSKVFLGQELIDIIWQPQGLYKTYILTVTGGEGGKKCRKQCPFFFLSFQFWGSISGQKVVWEKISRDN